MKELSDFSKFAALYIYIYIYMYVCMYVCIYICIYIDFKDPLKQNIALELLCRNTPHKK